MTSKSFYVADLIEVVPWGYAERSPVKLQASSLASKKVASLPSCGVIYAQCELVSGSDAATFPRVQLERPVKRTRWSDLSWSGRR